MAWDVVGAWRIPANAHGRPLSDHDAAIDTVATLAAAETTPSAATASTGVTVPALYVVGSQDTVVRPATTQAMYAPKPAAATFANITGGYPLRLRRQLAVPRTGLRLGDDLPVHAAVDYPHAAGELVRRAPPRRPTGATPAGVVVVSK